MYNRDEIMPNAEQLVVARVFPYAPEEHGGVERNANEGASHLRREGITVYTFGPRPRDKKRASGNIPHFGTVVASIRHDETKNELVTASTRAAKIILERINPDIIHTDEIVPAASQFIALSVGARQQHRDPVYGATFHSRLEREWSSRKNAGAKFLSSLPVWDARYYVPTKYLGKAFPYAKEKLGDNLIAVSKATANFWSPHFPNREFTIIPNGIDTHDLTIEGPVIDEWKADGKKIVGIFGRQDKRKGVDIAISAFARIRATRDDIKMIIIGNGEMHDELERMVVENQIPDVYFDRRLYERDEYVRALRTIDVMIASAIGGEGAGRVPQEALAVGKPVLASDIPAFAEYLGDNPLANFIETGNVKAFAYALAGVLDAPAESKQLLAHVSHRYIDEHYGWPKVAKQQAEEYRKWYSNKKTTV